MYAIVEIAGKQYKVRENDRLYVSRQQAEPESSVTYDRVLLVAGDKAVHVGQPTVDGAEVSATVLEHVKADKVLVFKKKRRKRYRVKRGHRQPYTRILIDSVTPGSGTKPKAKKVVAAPKVEAPKAEAPKAEAPKAAAPKAEAPKAAAPKAEAPKAAAPKAEAPKAAAPKAEAPKAAAPKAEAPKAAAPKAEAPKAAAPKAEAPKAAAPKAETPKAAAPKAKAPKAAAPKAKAPKAKAGAKKADDLKKIEGIGPKYASILGDAGVETFAKLADLTPEAVTAILTEAGPRYASATTDTWPEQAALAAAGKWDELEKLQNELDGGRRA